MKSLVTELIKSSSHPLSVVNITDVVLHFFDK